MSRAKMIRVAGAATGAVVVLGAMASALLLFSGSGPQVASAATPVAWYLPLLAGACIACLAWAMLTGRESDTDADVGRGVDSCCASCGGTINSGWRLCPHCGERFTGDTDR